MTFQIRYDISGFALPKHLVLDLQPILNLGFATKPGFPAENCLSACFWLPFKASKMGRRGMGSCFVRKAHPSLSTTSKGLIPALLKCWEKLVLGLQYRKQPPVMSRAPKSKSERNFIELDACWVPWCLVYCFFANHRGISA